VRFLESFLAAEFFSDTPFSLSIHSTDHGQFRTWPQSADPQINYDNRDYSINLLRCNESYILLTCSKPIVYSKPTEDDQSESLVRLLITKQSGFGTDRNLIMIDALIRHIRSIPSDYAIYPSGYFRSIEWENNEHSTILIPHMIRRDLFLLVIRLNIRSITLYSTVCADATLHSEQLLLDEIRQLTPNYWTPDSEQILCLNQSQPLSICVQLLKKLYCPDNEHLNLAELNLLKRFLLDFTAYNHSVYHDHPLFYSDISRLFTRPLPITNFSIPRLEVTCPILTFGASVPYHYYAEDHLNTPDMVEHPNS